MESDGLVDVTSGILRRAWRFSKGRVPRADEIEPLLERVGWHRLRWQPPLLSFGCAGMEVDLGGIVKEYAADRAVAICRAAGLASAMVNLGGDVAVIGPRPDGEPWRIGFRDPRAPDALASTVGLDSGAVASSGDYQRCIVVEGVRYGHVLDPRTGWPVRHLAAVSVVADLCVVAGSAATIAMLRERDGPAWLDGLGLPYLWIDAAGCRGGAL